MIKIKSYNTRNNLIVVNTFTEDSVERNIFMIPLNVATNQFNFCLNCDVIEDEDLLDDELKPLLDGFDYIEMDFDLLRDLLNDGSLDDYKFDKSEIDQLIYEQHIEEFEEQ